ncbi:MAG: tetratricopeptide repeat protein [Bacteroidales bacterium]|nr:tetratricopeptide repeat protein [Bacteroidales bacterium]
MFRKVSIILVLAVLSTNGFTQSERKYIRKGNDAFEDQAYTQSEINYRKAAEKSPHSYKAIYNMGDALYKQGKYEEAAKKFVSLTNRDLPDNKLAKAYHNLGNAFLKSDQLKESIEAYKNALKLNPNDIETKHNLTHALRKLRQKQQQKNNNRENQDNRNQNKNKQNPDQNQQNQNQQNQQKKQNQDKQKKRQQPQKDRITKQDAKRLLQALENDEKELQKKLKKKKAKAKSAKSTKNW